MRAIGPALHGSLPSVPRLHHVVPAVCISSVPECGTRVMLTLSELITVSRARALARSRVCLRKHIRDNVETADGAGRGLGYANAAALFTPRENGRSECNSLRESYLFVCIV